jgi:hypothetical protein
VCTGAGREDGGMYCNLTSYKAVCYRLSDVEAEY